MCVRACCLCNTTAAGRSSLFSVPRLPSLDFRLPTNHLLALSKKEYCKKYPRQNIFKKIIKIPENGLFWRAQNTCPANTTALAEDIEVGAREFNVAVLVER